MARWIADGTHSHSRRVVDCRRLRTRFAYALVTMTRLPDGIAAVTAADGSAYAVVDAHSLVRWTDVTARAAIAEALADPAQRDALLELAAQLGAPSRDPDLALETLARALVDGSLLAFEAPAKTTGMPITRREPETPPPVRPTPVVTPAWVSFELVDHQGTPLGERTHEFEHADGRLDSVTLDARGRSPRISTTSAGGIHLTWPKRLEAEPGAPRMDGFVAKPDDIRVSHEPNGTTRLGLNRHWRIVVAARLPTLLRLEIGALDYADRCVLLLPRPGAGQWHPWAALVTVARHLNEHPGDKLIAVGHRDGGEPGEHGRLRAAALVHFLEGEREAWVAIAAKWGRVRDTQEYLAYLRHARGWPLPVVPITDHADDATAAAVRAFQQACNAHQDGAAEIFEDGVIGEQTLGALFDTARTELRQWLGLHRTDCDAFVWHDPSQPAIDCAEGLDPYRTLPALAVQRRGRLVDLVIVPEHEAGNIDLGRPPRGAGVYDVAEIRTLALGEPTAPRLGMSIEIALRDTSGEPIPEAAFEVQVPGGGFRRGHLDAHGEARIDDLAEGWCRVRFPDLPNGCDIHDIATLDAG